MSLLKKQVLDALKLIELPDESNVVLSNSIRAFDITDGVAKFVIEIKSNEIDLYKPIVEKMKDVVENVEGIVESSIVLTAEKDIPETQADPSPPNLKVGRHPDSKMGSLKPNNVKHIIAVGSGKGGVGKSTLSANLAVSLVNKGLAVGLLDADIYGPSQPKMLGVSDRPKSPDGKTIIPLKAFGVTIMSIGLMIEPAKAVVWRGPMLMGALQQMLSQVEWGDLDVLIVDLPPGTGDVQLTLCQKADVSGALIVSTPQDVALIDARKAIDMFKTLDTPILGLIENMSNYQCPKCGYEVAIFGHGGVVKESENLGLSFLGEIPLDLEIRLSGDNGCPVSTTSKPISEAFNNLAEEIIKKLSQIDK